MSGSGTAQAGYTLKTERDVFVPMRDGVRVAIDIFRPDAEGQFPVLLGLSPYGKEIQSMPIPALPPQAPYYSPAIEAGDPDYFVSHGYVHIIGDVRGSGKSEGEYRGWMSKQEAEDGYDLVEWIAEQPWCDGNVGMCGISYYGTIQLSIAAEQPPHLKAIMPFNAPADFYRECTHHGGIVQTFFWFLYGNPIRANQVSVTAKESSPEELQAIVEKFKADPDLLMYPDLYAIVDNHERIPCFFDVLVNPTDGPFYWERSAYTMYDKINIPCYFSSGWWAYAHMHLRGVIQNYLGIDAPTKLMLNKPTVLDCPLPREFNEETLRWYDYWLKGIDTGVMEEPPIKIFVMGAEKWRFEHEWPLARTDWNTYYLRRWQKMLPEPEHTPGRADHFVQQPPDETLAVNSADYLAPPFAEDTEITGPMVLNFYAAIDQDDTNWIIAVRGVAPDNSEYEVTRGWLKASHRAVDESRSETWKPYHPHVDPEPVAPGEIYQYNIELSPTSYVFKAGHRIKLLISSMDHIVSLKTTPAVGAVHMPFHVCGSKTTLHKIFHDDEHPSHLLVPIIPKEG